MSRPTLCYVLGKPLVECHADGTVSGVSVDYLNGKLGGTSEFDVSCVAGVAEGVARGCDVIAGWASTYSFARIPKAVFELYSIGQTYTGSAYSILFAPQFDDASFIFFRPFTTGVWVLLIASIAVAVLAMVFVNSSTTRRASVTRDGFMSLLGYSRLYKGKDASYFQHSISVLTAIFSVIVVSMYSSNLVARSYISNQQTPDLTSKKIAYQSGGSSRWFAEMYKEHRTFGADTVLPTGSPNVTFFEGAARGEYFVVTDTLFVDALCEEAPHLSLISTDVFGLTKAYAPLVRNSVREDVFRALVYEPAMTLFHAREEPACFLQNESYVKGFGVYETWSVFVLVGGAAVALVLAKFVFVFAGRVMNNVPRESNVIELPSREPSSADLPKKAVGGELGAWVDIAL